MSHIARRGADVVTPDMKHVHVSGHGSAEELKLVLSLVRPRYFVPIHGEYRQLSQHARVRQRVMRGADRHVQVLLAQDGDIIQFDAHGARIADKAPTGRVLIDVDAGRRGRRRSAARPPAHRRRRRGRCRRRHQPSHRNLAGDPELVARGFVVDEGEEESLFDDAAGVIARMHRGRRRRGTD